MQHTRGKISYLLHAINIGSLLALAIAITFFGGKFFSKAMHSEIERELSTMSSTVVTMLDTLYPGDYTLIGEGALKLMKGEKDLTTDFTLVDRIKEDTGLDITLYYKDTRILTTVYDNNHHRLVGTGAPAVILEEVLRSGNSKFYDNILLYNQSYFTYYTPIQNSNGTKIGMLAVGKPTEDTNSAVNKAVLPLTVTVIILSLIAFGVTYAVTKNIANALLDIHQFLGQVSKENLNSTFTTNVTRRNDELGEIATRALEMQGKLRTLVERDALTTLLNRRAGDRQLKQIISKSFREQTPFCVCIGDIDFFKKVNDTYGHDCGDLVLKNVAYQLKTHMRGNGIVARWGGEEFLFVFDNKELSEAHQILSETLDAIRAMDNLYEDQNVKVTMSFGLAVGDTEDVTVLLHNADEKLYTAKSSGRNQIVID